MAARLFMLRSKIASKYTHIEQLSRYLLLLSSCVNTHHIHALAWEGNVLQR